MAKTGTAATATCQWDCHCWDCATDRRNSIGLALLVACGIALASGVFVAYEASRTFDFDEPEDPALPGMVELASQR